LPLLTVKWWRGGLKAVGTEYWSNVSLSEVDAKVCELAVASRAQRVEVRATKKAGL